MRIYSFEFFASKYNKDMHNVYKYKIFFDARVWLFRDS